MYTIYQIQMGDTIEKIASMFGMSIDDLANLNGFMIGTSLNPGDYIVVPKESKNEYFDKYTIQRGDNIYQIARSYNIDPASLLRLNGLNENDIIYSGETIYIPKKDVIFYITESDDTLNNVVRNMNVSPSDLAKQNSSIYLTNDQLIVYKK